MNWKPIYLWSLPLFFLGCLGEDIEELPFAQINLAEASPGDRLGDVELRAEVQGLEGKLPDEYGFAYANELDLLLPAPSQSASALRLSGALNGPSFDTLLSALSINQTYYFRAYLRQGERTVWSEVRSLALGVQIGISPNYEQRNDTVEIEGFVTGFELLPSSAAAYGHVYSAEDPIPVYGEALSTIFENLNGDISFRSTLPNLAFNTTYFVRSYLRSASGATYYSPNTLTVKVEDGWRLAPAALPDSLQDAAATVVNGQAYVMLGRKGTAPTNEGWRYNPASQSWAPLPAYANVPVSNAVAFAIEGVVYAGFGVTEQGFVVNNLMSYNTNGGDTWEAVADLPGGILARQGAVAFVLNGKAYIGTGADQADNSLNDFWEFNPALPASEQWRQVASMPLRAVEGGPVQTDMGRSEAVAMPIGGMAYVGGGNTGLLERRDFWVFAPPANENDTGSWVFHSWLPAEGRTRAASFTLADKGYMGTGANDGQAFFFQDFWEFDPASETNTYWRSITPFLGGNAAGTIGFALDGQGYIGFGIRKAIVNEEGFGNIAFRNMWEYTPRID